MADGQNLEEPAHFLRSRQSLMLRLYALTLRRIGAGERLRARIDAEGLQKRRLEALRQ